MVVKSLGPDLLGRDWLEVIKLAGTVSSTSRRATPSFRKS